MSQRAPATLRDVASRAGVATITASRILNGSRTQAPIAPETRRKVQQAAAELGYRLDGIARAMRHRRTGQIGVVVANVPGQLMANLPAYECILGLNVGLEEHGYVVSLVRITDVDGRDPQRARAIEQRLLDGLVVLGHMPPATVRHLRERGQPTIWLDTDVDEAAGCLRRDEVHAGAAAAGLLLARGRRRLLWARRSATVNDHYSMADREAGARAAAGAAGLALEPCIIDEQAVAGDGDGLRRLLADPAVGLLLPDPQTARRAQSLLLHLGLVPGRACGVAACDADFLLSQFWPELSRVEARRDELGRRAAAMLVALLAEGAAPASQRVAGAVVAGATA